MTDRYELQKVFGSGHYLMGAPFPPGAWWATSTEDLAKFPGYSQPKS